MAHHKHSCWTNLCGSVTCLVRNKSCDKYVTLKLQRLTYTRWKCFMSKQLFIYLQTNRHEGLSTFNCFCYLISYSSPLYPSCRHWRTQATQNNCPQAGVNSCNEGKNCYACEEKSKAFLALSRGDDGAKRNSTSSRGSGPRIHIRILTNTRETRQNRVHWAETKNINLRIYLFIFIFYIAHSTYRRIAGSQVKSELERMLKEMAVI
jgi:hypothetical protein